MDQAKLKNLFQEFLTPAQILDDPASLASYGRDWLKDFQPNTSLVVFPENTAEVQQIVGVSRDQGIALVPSGGRTGLSGGATALHGEVIVSFEKMRKIFEFNPIDRIIRTEAGVTLQSLQEKAANEGFYFPVDLPTKGTAQVGGVISTNGGGIRVVKWGMMRDWVAGLVVVLANGEKLTLNGSLVKNNTGYDLRQIFIGAEGTLGFITEATLRLTLPPKDPIRVFAALSSYEASLPVFCFIRDNFSLTAFEFLDQQSLKKVVTHKGMKNPFSDWHPGYVLIEVEGGPQIATHLEETLVAFIEQEKLRDVVVGQNQGQGEALFALRESISETLTTHYTVHKNDISVPISSVPAFLDELSKLLPSEYPGFEACVFGHIGDGNLHINFLKPASMADADFFTYSRNADHALFSLIAKFSGSISAEHGVGLLKKDYLSYSRSDVETDIMKGIKKILDPDNRMNPRKIF